MKKITMNQYQNCLNKANKAKESIPERNNRLRAETYYNTLIAEIEKITARKNDFDNNSIIGKCVYVVYKDIDYFDISIKYTHYFTNVVIKYAVAEKITNCYLVEMNGNKIKLDNILCVIY